MTQLKTALKARFPRLIDRLYTRPRSAVERVYARVAPPGYVFARIYRANAWGSEESGSGVGSEVARTALVRAALPGLLRELEARSLLDAPCGDFNWLKEVDLGVDRYVGVDVVPEVVAANQRYANEVRQFAVCDITVDSLPRADVVFCRDCLVHLSFRRIRAALRAIKRSGATYLITTTFPGIAANEDINTGDWRPLDLTLAPFRFPAPLRLIHENDPPDQPTTKSLGVWRLADLHV